ncbi:MAG TPA: HupE/UreJ family protein [Rhodothermales bacterium]|nr:HupE/UreJ family protein [Rhodothermales bacterium]
MGSEFLVYLRLGFEHIADINGYDHVLFITALCAVYALRQWRQVLWLVTAFTVGHSITLALATLRLVTINDTLVEVLIPVTIFVTSVINILEADETEHRFQESKRARRSKYGLALAFGLIHGLGFSNFLRSILGAEESLFIPLLAFNLGLEAGQVVILFFVLLLSLAMIRLVKMTRYAWILVLSGATAGVALTMIVDRLWG